MRPVFIVNPAAADGRLGRRLAEVRDGVRSVFGDRAEVLVTDAPGHATVLARSRADRDVVVAAGGDGTAHEVAEGLVGAGGRAALAVLPLGTGNDLAFALGFTGRLESCLSSLESARRSTMDHGEAVLDGATDRVIPFFNNVGLGFDALASYHAVEHKSLPGALAYVAGVLRALAEWRGPRARIDVDGVSHDFPLMFATVANGTRSGGLFRLTPDASLFDGLLDVCSVQFVRRGRALLLAPRTLTGGHVHVDEVRMQTGSHVRLSVAEPVPVHIDGEVVTRSCALLDIKVIPGSVPVMVPDAPSRDRTMRGRGKVL